MNIGISVNAVCLLAYGSRLNCFKTVVTRLISFSPIRNTTYIYKAVLTTLIPTGKYYLFLSINAIQVIVLISIKKNCLYVPFPR